MTFRDDHEAAVARAEALEHELELEREKIDDQAMKIADIERERRRLEVELASRRAQGGGGPDPSLQRQGKTGFGPVLALGVLALISGFIVLASGENTNVRSFPPNPSCTLDTIPSGAKVYAIRHDAVMERMNERFGSKEIERPTSFEVLIGTTPITKSRTEWIIEGVIGNATFEARLDNHAPISVGTPLDGMGCSNEVFRFPIAEAP